MGEFDWKLLDITHLKSLDITHVRCVVGFLATTFPCATPLAIYMAIESVDASHIYCQ